MRGRYTAFIEKTVAKIFAHPSLFPGFVSLIFWIGNPFLANAQCTIRIQSVNVDCSFDNGSNVFAAEVAVRWSSAPGSSIQVNVGGQSQLFTPSAASGVHTFSGFTLPSPGYGYPVTARFTGPGACEDFSTADAVACTPPCLATPTTIGGMAWKENVADGLFDGEPGQPNIKIEVYDCEEQLRGTAFTNADGQWSVTGLNAGEEYRVEFSTQQVPGINPSLAGPDNGSPVQFVMAGDCSVNAAFMEQSARYCSNPDNPTSLDCSGAPNVLDWRAFTNGANPFPAPPFVAQVNQDEVFWARTLDGATPYAHRVYHSSYGGADAYYLLEMDAGVPAAAAGGGMGVVFAFSRPVAELSFSLLDIDLAGNAIDRVSVQGYLGGVPVSLSLADIAAGSAVSVLEPYLFEGTSPVDDASDAGNVTIRFGQPVDQLAITLSSVSPEDGGGVQGIGIGNISWCAEPASLEPECVRIFDWMAFPDNNDPTPYSIDGVALDVQKNDPFGIASGSAFLSDNDFSPQGGQRGFWAIGMDAAAQGQYVENIITFSQPVSQLAFSILDIDESGGQGVASLSYQDRVTVHGFLGGEEIPAGLSDITAGSGVLGGSFDIASPNEYSGNGLTANGASADGNLALQFPGDVDSVVIRLYAGPDGPANPGVQQIGLSDLNFCICRPAPLQIGDFVWEDENGNGIQEACELPLPNLPVALYDEAGTLLATTQSDTAGRYHFTRPDTPGEDWLAGDGLQPNTPYFIVFGNDAANPDDRFLLVNDILYVPTGRHAGNGANPYMNDSDPDPDALSAGMPGDIPDGLPYVSFSTGDIGQGNPTLDAGFIPARFDLALRMVLNEELTPPPFYPGDIVNYSITVFNQGMVPTSLLTLVDYYPDEAMELVDDGIWFYENGVTYTRWPLPNIGPGDSLSLNISLRIKASNPLDTIINRTEVYHGGNSFNLPDVDSTPDGQPDNDAGGAPGSEADNAINGDGTGPVNGTEAATDEDDHDVEQIAVLGITPFDLALDLSLIGDGPFYSGDDVTFSIEVVNEGALEATMVQLNSYIPNGFTLNDPAWVVSGSAAQLSTPIDVLPSGTSVFREVTFRIDQSFVGDTITQTVEIADATNAMGESDADSTPNNQQPSEDDQASAKIGVNPVFDLSLEKRVVNPGPYYPGDQVTFTIRVTNEGNVPAQDVQIIDFVPYGLTLNHNSWSYSTNNIVRINNAIPNIAPGNTVTRQITFTIADDFPGTSITNYAEIFFATNQPGLADRDSNPGNFSDQEDDDDTATIGIWQPGTVFDLALKKEINYQMTPGPFEPGDYISFNITVTNEGNMAANGIQVLDQLPAGTTLEDNGWNLSGSMALSGSPISNLWPGESATLTIRLRINDDFDGDELINRAEVFSAFNSLGVNDIDSTPGNGVDAGEDDEGIAVVPVEQPLPAFDLSLVKKVKTSETPGPFYPGSTVTFSIRVSNEGNIDAESVSVIDYIPPGLILADDNWSQVFGSAVLSEPITGLAAGESATVDITFTISDDFTGQLIANVAEVNSATNSLSMPDEDSTPANAQDTEDDIGKSRIVVVQTYDLALSKTLNTSLTPAPYQPGGQVAFNLTVYNQGSLAANNITLYDYYPPGLQLNDSNWQAIQGNILRLANPIPVLEPGQSATVTILFDITNDVMNGDSLVNCAELGASTNINGLPDADSTPSNGSHDEDDDDTETILISIPKRFDLALSKSVDTILTPGPYYPGSTVAYNITVKNEGEEVAQGIQVQDYIPQGLILTSQDWSALGSIATLNSPVTSLLPGDSTTLNITFTISPVFQGASLTNYAEIAGSNANSNLSDADSTPGNGSAGAGEDDYDGATIAVTRQDFDLALRKRLKSSETPGPFVPGSTVTFEIEVSNEGDLTAQNIQLREYFPSGLLLTDPDWNAVGNVAELAFPIPSLAPGAITVVDVSFTVAPGFSGSNLTNFAEVGSAFNILGYDDMDSTPGNGSLGPNEDDYDDASITVIQQEFDLALSKELKTSATPGPFFPGSNVTYSITITNEGDLEAQNVQLRDYIPLGLVLADNNWTLNGSMAVRSTGSLQPGASATYDISFTISDAFSGLVLANYAEVGSAANTMGIQDKDSTPGNGSAAPNEDDYDSASITVIQDEFDLSLTKELNTSLTPGPFVPGSSVTFRITVTNEGGLAAQNIQVRDYIPLGLVLADNNWTLNGSMAVRNIASLQPGASIVLNISFTISPSFGGQLLNNSAEVGAASNSYGLGDRDSTPGNGPAGPNEDDYDSASITVIQDEFDLSLTKELNTSLTPGPFVPGSTVTFRITVANEGDLAAQNVQVLDYIPLGLILTDNNWSSNGNLASRAISNLAPGSSTTLNITFTVASNFSGTAIANYAEVGSANNIYGLDDRDSTPGNGSSGAGEDDFDGASISVVQQPFDLALSKELNTSLTPGPFYPGSTVTFQVTVTNEGGISAQNIQVRDYIPLGLVLADNDWTLNGSMAYTNIGALQPGESASVDITFTISPNFTGFFITNFAEIGAAGNAIGLGDTDSTPGNGSAGAGEDDFDSAGITVNPPQQFDLTLSKTVSSSTPGPYYAGSPVTFKLTVTNQGNVTAQSIQLWDYLPPALTLSDAGWTQNGGVASYNTPIASLAPGASVTVEIDFVVSAGFGGTSTVNYAEISGAFNGSGLSDEDSTPGNGSSGANEDDYDGAAINISVTPQFDLALRKQLKASATPGPFSPGSPVIFRITVVNQGNMDAYNVEIADYIPAGLVLTDGNWTQSGSMATRTIPGPILPGGTATADISFVIDQNFVGNTIMNYAEIMSADDDNDAGNGAPVDIDSQYDTNPDNDAGGLAGSPSDDAINGDGSGQPGSSQASTDEDDQDPALIVVGNCPDAGTDGFVEVCLTCTSDDVFVDLTAALGGSPSPGGAWTDLDGSGVSLADPSNVNFMGLPGGDYQFEYSVGGQNGCPILSATVVVSLSTSLDNGCNSQINVPVGNNSCEVLVTPSMVLSGSSNTCTEGLTVNLLDPNGVSLGNTFTADMAGQTLIAEVLDPNCGLVCWGYVYVQDFTPPAISCPVQDIDLVCSDLDSILNNPASLAITGMPEIYDTCVQHTVTFQDQEVMTPDCVSRQINRVFTVTDPMGNSVQCTQVITARNPTFADLLPLPSQLEIPCDSNFVQDQNGNPDPSVTGYPMVQAYFGAHPLNQAYCTLGASYTDSPPIDVCEGTIRIIRHWEILDWCENSPNSILELTQFITVGDVAGPEVSCPEIDFNGDGYPDPLNFSTSSYDCTATFQAPLPIVTDNCSSWEVRTDIISDEVVPVTNQFGIITGYDTVATIIATILPGEPRLVSDIPVGCYRFSYKVTDDCNNYTQLECDFCVVDNVQPTAICDDALTVSLGGLGLGRVYAEAVNESSTDNCGIDTMLVRRLYEADPLTCDSVSSYYSDWAPYVDFSCCDVSQLATVELLVIDGAGNQNTCWMEVLVEDKVLPDCYAPNDTTVSCSSLPDNFDPNDTGQLQALFGAATAEDACGGAYVVEQAPLVNLDQCNAGTITRAFQAVDLSGNLSQSLCVQVITITSEYNYEIKFPKDFTTNCTVPTPDTLIYTSFGCDMLSVSVTDEVFTPLSGSPGPECYKIFRKYRVLNWCEYDGLSDAVVIGRNEDCDGVPGDEDVWVVRYPNGAWIDRDNDPSNNIPAFGAKGVSCDGTTNPTGFWRSSTSVGLWEYTQIIKVIDTIPPEINFTAPGAFCSYDGDSCLGQVQYPFTVTDDCSATGLTLEVFLDANADGTIDEDLTNAGVLSGTQPNFSIQGDFPIGSHAFIIQASDGCGNNPASATLPFEVVDCQPPAFTCYSGLSFGLSSLPPNTDLDGDGINDAAGAAVWASDLILNASDCSDDTIAYSINLAGEAPDIGQQVLYFTCEDTGTIAVQVYVWDSAYNPYAVQPDGSVGGPNYSICDTYVTIQDSTACNGGLLGPMMAGLIAREDNMGVENVEVSLSGPQSLMMLSEVDGTYQFDNLDTGYDYTLSPYLNTDHRNGISTFDLLIIQQHLLGVQPLDSPYKRIAADANHSGNITTLDMIQIQQLILGEILEFPNNTSWRFVDKAFVFPVPTNPWFTPFPEVISVNNLSYPMMANDFVAIKIGDVNNSAVTTGLMGVDGRSFDGTFYLEAPQLELKKGEVAAVPFSARELEAIRGCQFTLDFDPGRVELTDVEYGLADENSIGFHGLADGFLTVSWYRKGGVSYPEGEPLFTLFFRAKENTNLKDLLSISSRYTLAEAYTPGQELLDVALRFGSGRQEEEGGVFRLYQNRPNPFSEESAIGFELPESGAATLSVFDLNGRLLYRKQDLFDKGYNELILKREGLRHLSGAGGVLYYKLQMGNRVATRKMIILE